MWQLLTSTNRRVDLFCRTSFFLPLFLFTFVFGCAVSQSQQKPDGLSAEPFAPSAVRLTWEDPDGSENGYRIERRIMNDPGAQWHGEWHVLAEVSGNRRRFESVGLRGETVVRHRIREKGKSPSTWHRFEEVDTPPSPEGLRGDVLVGASDSFKRNTEGDIIELKNGDLLYIYGRWPGAGDHARRVRLGIIRSQDGGDSWSEPETLLQVDGFDLYHVSLVRLDNGHIGMSYTKRKQAKKFHQTGEKMFRFSDDEGETWSEAFQISDGDWSYYQSSRNDVLTRLESGRLVHTVTRMLTPGKGPEGGLGVLIYYSDDRGRTWHRATPDPLREPNEDVLQEADTIEYAPGKLLMLGRTYTGWFYASRSTDGGESWSTPEQTWIPSAIAPPQLFHVPGRDAIMLAWNPFVGKGRRLGPRPVLGAWFSTDGGRSWSGYRQLESGPTKGGFNAVGYCYASGTWVGTTLHMAYMDMQASQKGTARTRYQRLNRDELLQEDK